MIVGERDQGWVLQDGKPLLFADKAEAEEHAAELNARSADAQYTVAPWPQGREGGR
jgi:hypothetical protein